MSRMLFALSPITGHVRPALPIARDLVAAGHDVAVYTGTKFAPAIRATGATVVPIVRGRDIDAAELDDWAKAQGAPTPGVRRLQWDVRHVFVDPVAAYVEDLGDVRAVRAPAAPRRRHGHQRRLRGSAARARPRRAARGRRTHRGQGRGRGASCGPVRR